MGVKKNPKSKRSDAERAAEWYAIEVLKCVVTRRAVHSRFHKIDFFGSDVMGKRGDGQMIFIQATAGQHPAVTKRRRKLEDIPWHETDIVLILQLIQTIDPANARRKKWFFRVHTYRHAFKGYREWLTEEKAVPIPKLWFKSYELYQKKLKKEGSGKDKS